MSRKNCLISHKNLSLFMPKKRQKQGFDDFSDKVNYTGYNEWGRI
jgi:hypothetical protein